jgi:type IV pilus assembly protein PilY1
MFCTLKFCNGWFNRWPLYYCTLLLMCISLPSWGQLQIPDVPLFLVGAGVEPNMILTIDDSGSMRRTYVPDSLKGDLGFSDDTSQKNPLADNRFRAASVNAMYYNPYITYRIPVRGDGSLQYETRFDHAYYNGFDVSRGWVDLNTDYYVFTDVYPQNTVKKPKTDIPADYYLYYQDKPGAEQPRYCDGSRTDRDCYIQILVGSSDDIAAGDREQRKQNFANWYSFYRSRALTTMSAVMISIASLPEESVRLGWQTLNRCKSFNIRGCRDYSRTYYDNRLLPLTLSRKSGFFDWLERIYVNSSTTLRDAVKRAGEFYRKTGTDSAYAAVPYSEEQPIRACRKNFHVLFTDGLWNASVYTSMLENNDLDSTITLPLPDGQQYTPRPPYQDVSNREGLRYDYTNSKSFADIALYYWSHDLNPMLADDGAPQQMDFFGDAEQQYWNPKNNPATWQHMVNYVISLGLSTTLVTDCISKSGLYDPNNPTPGCPEWAGNTYAGGYHALVAGEKNWPKVGSDYNGNVYDLWHGAINSRGKFYSAQKPSELVDAFQNVIDTISAITAGGGGTRLGINTLELTSDAKTILFESTFQADWSARLVARSLNPDGSIGPIEWDAGQQMPAPAARHIYTIDDQDQATTFEQCTGDLKTALDQNRFGEIDGLCVQRLNWLRGDGHIEQATCTMDLVTDRPFATFRIQNHGFQVDDQVTVVGVLSSSGNQSVAYNGTFQITATPNDDEVQVPLLSEHCDSIEPYADGGKMRYQRFRARENTVLGDIMHSNPVYAGNVLDLNQGYGDEGLSLVGQNSYLAYVETKKTRLPMLYAGANDGMLHAFQADIGTADSGKEMFAYVPRAVYDHLNKLMEIGYTHNYYVDGPLTLADAYLQGTWGQYLIATLGAGGRSLVAFNVTTPQQFTADDILWEWIDDDFGLVFGQASVVPIAPDRWAVIVGNGDNSPQEKAFLYVIDLATGITIAKVATDDQTGNSLSTPLAYDRNGDRIVDVIYAGDALGRLWKFESRDGRWVLGNQGVPLFRAVNSAGEAQPITTQPHVVEHPNGGYLIYVGTGRYRAVVDLTDDSGHSFYALWDDDQTGTLTPADLYPHRVINEQDFFDHTVRVTDAVQDTASEPFDWARYAGWRLDLPLPEPGKPSERIVTEAMVLDFEPRRVLFITTTPSDDPCDRGGTSWLMELDWLTGNRIDAPIHDFSAGSLSGEIADSRFDHADLIDQDGDGIGDTGASGVALPKTYGVLTSLPRIVTALDPDIDPQALPEDGHGRGDCIARKYFSGSTGVSGTADIPLQQTGQECIESSDNDGSPDPSANQRPRMQRIYWRQIL